jgi:hypothetical protein
MTDISNRAIIPQVNEPLGYVDGKPLYPTVAWQQFLDALWKRTGGFRDGLYDEVIRSLVEASEARGALASVESLTRALESLAQANDADIRQAIEASRQEASSRIDDARAQTLSSALETIESVRQETLARAADARAETLSSALELIEAARREIRAEAESTRAEVQSALAALGELARLNEAARRNIAVGAIGNQGQGFTASHAIRTLPAATPTSTASYTFLTQRTGFFTVPANSTVTLEVSFQFRAPSDLFDWFFYKYALRLEAEGGGTQTLIAAPVATRRKGEWVSGSMAGANYDRVEPFAVQFQIASEDIVPPSTTGRYRGAFDLEPDNTVNAACAEGWGATVTGTFAWQNVSLTAIAFNDGPIRS